MRHDRSLGARQGRTCFAILSGVHVNYLIDRVGTALFSERCSQLSRTKFRPQPAVFLAVVASTYVQFPLGTPLATQAAHVSINYAAVGVTAPRMVKGKTPRGEATFLI